MEVSVNLEDAGSRGSVDTFGRFDNGASGVDDPGGADIG